MKIAVLGDTHFDVSNSNEEVYEQQIKFFKEEFFPYLIENDIKTIFQLGDFFDNKLKVGTYIQSRLMEDFFDVLEENKIVMFYFVGNHDLYFRDSREVFSLKVFEKAYHANLKVVRNMNILDFQTRKYMFVPWLYDEDIPNMATMVQEYKPELIFGHFEIKDFHVSKDFQATHGLDKKVFKNSKVISGHFHLKQEIGNIFYVGTPYQSSWTDYNETKGFHILDTKDNSFEFVENTVSAKHIQIEVDSEDKKMIVTGFSKGVLEADINTKLDYSLFNGHNVKIFIDKDNAFNKKIVTSILKHCRKYKVKLLHMDDEIVEASDASNENDLEFNVTSSILERLETEYQKETFNLVHEETLKQIDD